MGFRGQDRHFTGPGAASSRTCVRIPQPRQQNAMNCRHSVSSRGGTLCARIALYRGVAVVTRKQHVPALGLHL